MPPCRTAPRASTRPSAAVVWVGKRVRSEHGRRDAEALIEALYTLGDIHSEVHGLRPRVQRSLDTEDDIGLVDDVIDALLDPAQVDVARPILREALARIAAHALGRD